MEEENKLNKQILCNDMFYNNHSDYYVQYSLDNQKNIAKYERKQI